MSIMKTALLLAAMTALFVAIGGALGGATGMVIAFAVAVGMNAFAYWNSDKMVLSMYGAQQVDRHTAPGLYSMVERLAARAGMPMPKVFIIHSDQPNAFATGRDPEHASVAATTGLLDNLAPEEIEGVMAHELAHVKNRDTLIMTITASIAGAIGMIANFGMFFGSSNSSEDGEDNGGQGLGLIGGIIVAIVAPMAAMVVQMAISRTREYAADAEGARICGNPLWLASALARLEQVAHAIPNHAAERSPATAHMFIVNPLSGRSMDNLFSTHPSMDNRIQALRQMAASQGMTWDRRPQTMGSSAAPRSPSPDGQNRPNQTWGSQNQSDTKRGPWG